MKNYATPKAHLVSLVLNQKEIILYSPNSFLNNSQTLYSTNGFLVFLFIFPNYLSRKVCYHVTEFCVW